LELSLQVVLALCQGCVTVDESFQQARELFTALRQLGNLMLTIYLNLWNDVGGRYLQDITRFIAHYRRIWDRPLDQIVPFCGPMSAHQERNLGAILQDMADNAFVCLAGVLSKRLEAQHVTEAFDDGRFAGSSATDQNIEILVEMNRGAVEKATLPR